jgi:RNA polymerase sigma-70 factor (ECF subfamily)
MGQDDAGELVRRSLAGDDGAFERLVEIHEHVVFSLAYQHSPDRSAAEDIAQEAFVRAYRNLGRLRKPSLFGRWLYGITVNVARERARGRKPTVSLESVRDRAAVQGRPEEEADADAVLGLVARLPDAYRIPLTLHYVRGLSYRVIGEQLGIAEATARSRVHRAREKLRKAAHKADRKRA